MDGGGRRPKLEPARLAADLHYRSKVPIEIVILQAAEAWGTAPWEIEATPGGLRWLKLFEVYHKAREQERKMATTQPPS